MNRLSLVIGSVMLAAVVIGGAAYYRYTHPLVATTRPALAASVPASRAATSRAVARAKPAKGPTTQLLDIVRADNPRYPTTHRLEDPLDLRYAARLVLDDPVYLDNQGNLWITRANGPDRFDFAKASTGNTATHVVRDRVAFVWWSAADGGVWLPHLVVRDPAGKGYELVEAARRRPLADPHGFQWDRALVLPGMRGAKDRIVVPTAAGVCAFTFDDSPESIVAGHQQLIGAADQGVQLAMDVNGVIAYVTNAAGTRGAKGVARYAPTTAVEGTVPAYKWTVLTGTSGWPDHLLHLVPLLDGSVLQIVSAVGADEKEQDKVTFSMNSVTAAAIDEAKVLQLVEQLSADDQEKRDAAFKTLTTYGPGIAPLLEKVLEDQIPEAQIRIRQLLKNKIEPSLGSMSLVDGRMQVVNRLPDGGVIFYAEAGVAIPRADDAPAYVSPAWLAVRPGRAVELLPGTLVRDLSPDKHAIVAWGFDDYVVQDPVLGPQWFIGNHLEPLLRKAHRGFTQFVGIDMTGRWVFRQPPPDTATTVTAVDRTHDLTTAAPLIAATTQSSSSPTTSRPIHNGPRELVLIIDPRLPDPTPRLPSWLLPASVGKVGWDKDQWPVVYMDVKPNPVPWALGEGAWRVVDETKEKVFTDPADVPPAGSVSAGATTRPPASTTTTTSPASTTQAATRATGIAEVAPPLLVAPDGTRYYDGRQTLKVVRPGGETTDWPLPQSAVGSATPTLLRTREGLLFLFNEPGRVVRLRPTPDGDQRFDVDAVFTRGIPSDATPQRIWLDPADRICIAHGGNRITVLFPIGRIPASIAEKMRPEDFPPDDDQVN